MKVYICYEERSECYNDLYDFAYGVVSTKEKAEEWVKNGFIGRNGSNRSYSEVELDTIENDEGKIEKY